MFVAQHGKPSERNLGTVARLISGDVFGWARWAIRHTNDPFLIARLSRYAAEKAEDIRSLNEVIENTRTELSFLLEEMTAETLSRSDVTFSRCKRKVTSIYIIPPDEADGRFLRLLLYSALAELLRRDPKGNHRTLIMADEYYSLRMQQGDQIFATARKFNTQLWVCLQDMAQLKALHPQTSETFINNAGVLQWLDAGDLQGSRYVSELCGDTEVYGTSKSLSYAPENEDHLNVNEGRSQQARRLILPHEVRELGPREQILFVDGVRGAIKATRKPYFETRLKRLARDNPYYQKKGFWRKVFG
jgi:type IV secretory pathway TraG/TraD family ATPase VirD4